MHFFPGGHSHCFTSFPEVMREQESWDLQTFERDLADGSVFVVFVQAKLKKHADCILAEYDPEASKEKTAPPFNR
jgi:hypothetical protein